MISATFFTISMVFLAGVTVNYAYPTAESWPEECKGKSYCHIKPDYYPKEFEKLLEGMKFEFDQTVGISNRNGDMDIANCGKTKLYEKLYLIKDENDTIRFVAQNDQAFSIALEIEECKKPGPVDSSFLDEDKLKDQRVDCYETKLPMMLPVLSLDGTQLESAAPKGGIPMSCSAKVMET